MKKIYFSVLVFLAVATSTFAQGVYWSPSVMNPHERGPRLYVDLSSPECSCPELSDADPESNPLYFWSWGPNEERPPLDVNGSPVEVTNGSWFDSNESLRMKQDPFNPDLWYYDFLGASLIDFYNVPEAVFVSGVQFLVKEENGAPDGLPEQKSLDMQADVEFSALGDISIELDAITEEFVSPTVVTHAGDERLFVVEQPGFIRIFYRDGSSEETPFLDIEDRVEDFGSEQGLLGLAFPPDYCTDGRFYVNYTHTDQGQLVTRISRFEVDPDNPNQGDPDSEEILIQFDQDFSNHNGGHIEFGLDGFLYISTGDGGSSGDPNNRAQDITSYLGKMLRIDVSPETGYEIPLDNPYIFDDFGQDEIWSFGLRNAWKFAFDRATGNIYIADVGQNAIEEVNFELAGAAGGLNYGWRCYEGPEEYNLSNCEGSDYVFPITFYPHSTPDFSHCSVTGGRVYRGPSFESFNGAYFFCDFCSGVFWATFPGPDDFVTEEFGTQGASFVTTWGEDYLGEVYVGNTNQIYRLTDPADQLVEDLTLNGNVLSTPVEGNVYTWFLNGEQLSVTTIPSTEISETGIYNVEVQTPNGCTYNAQLNVTTLSTEDEMQLRQTVFAVPNPADEFVRFDADILPAEGYEVRLFSVEGRGVLSKTIRDGNTLLDVRELPSGLYIADVLALDGARIGSAKLVIR
jgi:glucose/arabinose dehydrogenase